MYSCYAGRPYSIKFSDVTIARPLPSEPKFHSLNAWIDLAIILADVTDILNGPLRNLDDHNTLCRLSGSAEQLLQWVKLLPPGIRSPGHEQGSYLEASVYHLHMLFYTTLILVHRPFAKFTLISRVMSSNRRMHLIGYPPLLSQKICLENSIRIVKGLSTFRSKHGIDKVLTSMMYSCSIAASTLIFHISTNEHHSTCEGERKWLEECLKIMDELVAFFPIADRIRKNLNTFLHYCGFSYLVRIDSNLDSASVSDFEIGNDAQSTTPSITNQLFGISPSSGLPDSLPKTQLQEFTSVMEALETTGDWFNFLNMYPKL